MSYYFAIIGTQDNPLFEYEFGTSKQGGDGIARFPEQARHMNQFIVHSSLDIVEEVQWGGGQMYSFLLLCNFPPDSFVQVSQVHRSLLQ
jgi:trafficking protein particle complex subunit 2